MKRLRSGLLGLCFLITYSFMANRDIMAADVTAKSCSALDIQTAINAVANGGGGTVNLPECDFEAPSPNGALWSSGNKVCLASVEEIRFIGAGQDKTRIGYASGGPGYGAVSCPAGYASVGQPYPIAARGVGIKEIAHFTIDINGQGSGLYWLQCEGVNEAGKRACTGACTGARVHHTTIQGLAANARGIYFCQNWRGYTVMDNLIITNTKNVAGIYGISINGGWGIESFVVPPTFGENDGLFIEDSSFDGLYHPIEGFYASRAHIRHNRFHNDIGSTQSLSGIGSHEACFTSGCGYGDPTEYIGAYRYEIYDNVWDAGNGVYLRGGFLIVTRNTFNSGRISSVIGSCIVKSNCTVNADCPWEYEDSTTATGCFQTPRAWIWNNKNQDVIPWSCGRIGKEYLLRAPQGGDPYYDGSVWASYEYPHPLRSTSPLDPGEEPPHAPSGLRVIEVN